MKKDNRNEEKEIVDKMKEVRYPIKGEKKVQLFQL